MAAKEYVYCPDPEIERDVYEINENIFGSLNMASINGSPNLEDPQKFIDLLNSFNQNPTGGAGPRSPLEGFDMSAFAATFQGSFPAKEPAPRIPETKFTKFLRTKMHLALVSFCSYYLTVSGYQPVASVFLMFLVWELAEVFIMRTYETAQTSLLGIVFLLFGIPAIHSTIVLKTLGTLYKVIRDSSVFVFFFVVCHFMWGILVLGLSPSAITEYTPLDA